MDIKNNAKALLAEDLLCAVCLSTYINPVSLSCGHSFCKECINRVLTHQHKSRSYRCPVCQVEYKQYPELMKNFPLCSIIESFNSLQIKKVVEGSIPCNYCLDDQSIAVKTCITCEVSLCQQHLDRHKNKSHVMVEPILSMENRKCPEHDKLLEFYCESDQSTVCVTCYIVGSHKGHRIVPLKEARQKQTEMLSQTIISLKNNNIVLRTDTDELQKTLVKVKENSENLSAPLKDLKAKIIFQVQDQWQNILDSIASSEHQINSTIDRLTKQMKKREAENMRNIQDLEKMRDQPDELFFVKQFQTVQDQIKEQNQKVDTLPVLAVSIHQQTVEAIEYRTVCYISEINQILQQVQSDVAMQTWDVLRSVGDQSSQCFPNEGILHQAQSVLSLQTAPVAKSSNAQSPQYFRNVTHGHSNLLYLDPYSDGDKRIP